MKIALIQDQLLTQGGSERVFLSMAEEFNEADIYTLCYNPETTWPEYKRLKIKTHWLNRFIQNHKTFKSMFPIASRAMSNWDFSSYDLVLTSSATTAKYIRRCKAPHICYCYFPTRAIWDFDRYFGETLGVAQRIFRSFLPYFKRRDFEAAQRVDHFVAISESSRQAIRKFYDRDAAVLFCPVDLRRLIEGASRPKKDYFLLVSRLERWKLVDYAIEAFNTLGLPLRIIGQGPEGERLRAIAKPNISFLGAVDDKTLVSCYGEARAVVFTPELEYGLVPIEAVATGTPVIALGRGGVLETMVDFEDPAGRAPTSILYPDPTADSLVGAIGRFELASFSKDDLVRHAASFGIPAFQSRLRAIVNEILIEFPINSAP